jgi:hypothetical protein
MNSSLRPTPRWTNLAITPKRCARSPSSSSSEKNEPERGFRGCGRSRSAHVLCQGTTSVVPISRLFFVIPKEREGRSPGRPTRARLRDLLLCDCPGVQRRPQCPIPPPPPLLSMLFKIKDLHRHCPTFWRNFLSHKDLSHNIPFKGLMIPRCARDFALRRCSGQAQIVKERTNAPRSRSAGRVGTDLPGSRRGGPFSKIPQRGVLSRLRRYRLGNCTFVTLSGQGNQQANLR